MQVKNPKILVVDDEATLVQTVRAYLEREGYAVSVAYDGREALVKVGTFCPELIILDIMLPGMDGMEVLRRLRQESEVYVLMLTARSSDHDKIMGLTYGADDYLTKPFNPYELVARVKAIFRRSRRRDSSTSALSFQRLRIDEAARQMWKDGQLVELTPTEFELLLTLARYAGQALSREQLIEQVWGHNFYGNERVVNVHLGRLRKKIEDDPANPALIATVRGIGYRFADMRA
jgi:two-component system alkaline phosphatase synthesis response regulator PhoP